MDRLIASAPDDASYKVAAEPTLLLLGESLLRAGRLDEARAQADDALAMAESAVRRDPSVMEWRGLYLGAARGLSIKLAAAQAPSRAAQGKALAPAAPEADRLARLSTAEPRRPDLAVLAAQAQLLAGDAASLGGDARAARASWAAARRTLERADLSRRPANDPGQSVRAQLDYRVQFSAPPTGPIKRNGALAHAGASRRSESNVNYEW